MNIITKGIAFQAFGYQVLSDIFLPELNIIKNPSGNADIFIEIADLTNLWNDLAVKHENFLVKKDFFLFKVTETAIFLVENGTKIKVSPLEGSSIDKIRLFLLGTCMGALLLQRKILPLHGSAIAVNGKAYAIVGHSGAGKSTLASVLMTKGYPLLSDDVIAVSLSEDNIPYVTPSYPQQKLWYESLDFLGMDKDHFKPLFEREQKFAIPAASNFLTESLPLAGVFEIVKTDTDQIEMNDLQSLQKLHSLFHHTYRNLLISKMDLIDWHFKVISKMASIINVYQICRPAAQFTIHQLETLVLTRINGRMNE